MTPEATEGDLRDRARGALLGLAVGNALGVPVEGRSGEDLRRRFPEGIRDIDPRERDNPWDDDVAQAILLAEAMLERGTLDLHDLAERMLAWARENGRGMGLLTSQVIGRLDGGAPADRAALEAWEESGRQAVGNGAVMRCPPVAVRWRVDPERLIEETRTSALVTHHDPRCWGSAVALNLGLAAALREEPPDLDAVAAGARESGAPEEVGEAVPASDVGEVADLHLDGPDMGHAVKAMQVGLWSLTRGVRDERSLETALRAVVEAGGDTDTNGAVAGAALGATAGASSIPARWVDALRDPEALTGLADRLADDTATP
jgi:ADP-ribosyl-[dinitrogen reductase] hydrolase